MNFKKTMAAFMVGAMVLSAAPVLPEAPAFLNTAYAAKGGAKMGGVKSAPKAAPAAPAAPAAGTSQSKSVSGNGSSYAPSKDAKSLEKNAPASNTNAKANTAANTNTQSSSRLGSIMRGIGLFAGGMLLGSMLSHFFGMGSGMFADIMGLLMNGIMIVAAIMVVRWLWNKFRGNKSARREETAYRQPLEMRQQDNASAPQAHKPIQDIKPRGNDYDAKSTADRYRNR